MSNRSAVAAAIVTWLARGASPIDGMYSFEVARMRREESEDARRARERRSSQAPATLLGVCRA